MIQGPGDDDSRKYLAIDGMTLLSSMALEPVRPNEPRNDRTVPVGGTIQRRTGSPTDRFFSSIDSDNSLIVAFQNQRPMEESTHAAGWIGGRRSRSCSPSGGGGHEAGRMHH